MINHIKILNEMPRRISQLPVDDDLSVYNTNQAKYKELYNIPNKQIYHKFDDNKVVYYISNKVFCLDTINKQIVYYMEYETSFNSILGSYAWQSLVWRKKNTQYINTLPHDIFFKVLLPKFGTVVTDGEQTDDGIKFWEYQIGYALNNNLNVYYFNTLTKELIHLPSTLAVYNLDQKIKIWGTDNEHKHKLVVITKKQLII